MIGLLEQGDLNAFWFYMVASIVAGIALVALGITSVSNKKTAVTR